MFCRKSLSIINTGNLLICSFKIVLIVLLLLLMSMYENKKVYIKIFPGTTKKCILSCSEIIHRHNKLVSNNQFRHFRKMPLLYFKNQQTINEFRGRYELSEYGYASFCAIWKKNYVTCSSILYWSSHVKYENIVEN